MRSAGLRTADSVVGDVEKAFPGIFQMSRDEFVNSLKAGRFGTEFADDMGGNTARKEIANITRYLKEGNALEQGMQEVHLPRTGIRYETKAFAYVREGEVVAGGYLYKKGAKDPWVRAGLYTSPKLPKSADKYSLPKVLSVKMMAAGGIAPKSLSTPGAKSYYDVVHSIRANMQHSTSAVKANTTGMTVPGLAQHPRRGGSRQGPQGGT